MARFIIGGTLDGGARVIKAADAAAALDIAIDTYGPAAVIEHPLARMCWAVPLNDRTARWFLTPLDLRESR